VHGLPAPERDGSAAARDRRPLHALAAHRVRAEGLGRGGLPRRAGGDRERGQRRARPLGRGDRHAADVAPRHLERNSLRETDMKDLVIDAHAHFIPKLVYERFDVNSAKFPEVKLLRDDKGVRMQFPGSQPTRPISPKLSDLADRRAWMDRNGIDHQLVGGWLDSFGYELPAGEGLAWSR